MNTTFIYSLVCPETNQVRYIGKANKPLKRLAVHLSEKRKTYKSNWINHLKSKGLIPILEIIDEVPLSQWQFWEMYYISLYKSWGFILVNTDLGGTGTGTMSIETKTKIGSQRKGDKNHFYGRTHSMESKKKMSESRLGENNAFFGKHHTEDTKIKISLKNKGNKYWLGKKHSEESVEKMSKSRIGLKPTPNTREKMSNNKLGSKNPRFGKLVSEETRNKIREGLKRYHTNRDKMDRAEIQVDRIPNIK